MQAAESNPATAANHPTKAIRFMPSSLFLSKGTTPAPEKSISNGCVNNAKNSPRKVRKTRHQPFVLPARNTRKETPRRARNILRSVESLSYPTKSASPLIVDVLSDNLRLAESKRASRNSSRRDLPVIARKRLCAVRRGSANAAATSPTPIPSAAWMRMYSTARWQNASRAGKRLVD